MVVHIEELLEHGFGYFNLKNLNQELYEELQQIYLLIEKNKDWILYLSIDKDLTKSEYENFKNDISSLIGDDELYTITVSNITNQRHSLEISINVNESNFDKVRKKVEDFSIGGNVKQYWYQQPLWSGSEERKWQMVHERADKILSTVYTHFYPYETEEVQINVTNFIKNCHIHPHQDGYNENRVCGILIYMNHDYPENQGGELVVGDEVIRPEFGRIVALDYTKHNLEHRVNKVAHDGNRFALLKFFSKKES